MRLGIELAVGVIDAVVGCSCCCCCLDCRNEAASDEEQSEEEPTYRRPRNAAGSGRNAYHLTVRCSVIECHKDCTSSPPLPLRCALAGDSILAMAEGRFEF